MPTHAYALPPWFGLALMAAVCGAAFWKGGREEQITAGALLLGWIATLIFRDPRWLGAQTGAFVVDSLFLVMIVVIALRSHRYWPIAAAAFQLLAIVTHAARLTDAQVGGWAYATASILWTQLLLLALAVGVWESWLQDRDPAMSDDPQDGPARRR